VKAPDVVWMSDARRAALPSDPTTLAPELCIEVVSASNTEAEIAHKRALYFDAGAEEVWTCDEAGRLRFFDADGTRATSALVPGAPTTIEV
jgi:Uma2 family endonuclease